MPWTVKDSERARSEGWDLFESSEHGSEIKRIDSPPDGTQPWFASDEEAVKFVRQRAQARSILHIKAKKINANRKARWGSVD